MTGKRTKSRGKREKRIDQTLKDVWYEGGSVVKYSLAYINARICAADNGRVPGYDNTHEYHHRHFMGQVENIEFHGYEALVARFERELHALWRGRRWG